MKKILAVMCSFVCVLSMAVTVYAAGYASQSRYDVVQGVQCYSTFTLNGLAPGYYATSEVQEGYSLSDVSVNGYVYREATGAKYNFHVTGSYQGTYAFAQDNYQLAVTHGVSYHHYADRTFNLYCDTR